jgi:hypothetical protein
MGNEFTLNDRESWVRMFDRWVPYPFQNNIRYLPKRGAYECIAGLIKAPDRQGHDQEPSGGQELRRVHRRGLRRGHRQVLHASVQLQGLGLPARDDEQALDRRARRRDRRRTRAQERRPRAKTTSAGGPTTASSSRSRGGTGEFYRRFGPALGSNEDGTANSPRATSAQQEAVASIDVDAKVSRSPMARRRATTSLISTMPLDVLCRDVLTG